MVADWQLPPGVNRGLWDYFRDPSIARSYDRQLVDAHLLRIDEDFVRKHGPSSGRLLDLGCGTGRLLVAQARRGFWCLGVDLSEEMLAVAAAKARDENVAVACVRANMVELACLQDGVFDVAACLFSTLGMVVGADNRSRVLAHVFRLLKPGGVFILHVHNRWFNFWHPQMRGWLVRDTLLSLLGRGAGDHAMPAHGGSGGLTLHLFTRHETLALLRDAGFRVTTVAPISLAPDGKLRCPYLFGRLRAYGYLIAATK